ncbi:AmmeMemoRadiSam system protein B, partial [Candidatus Bathyarchaeota archaeon]|nr:AmmeMemoRadiSam system protein B [Candidatus Bathyarchaeota archaeon]
LVCPHAGYMYSGPVAAHAYYELAKDGKPEIIVIFSPNHTGRGSALSIMNEGVWRTPMGDAEIDSNTANRILSESRIIDVDDRAHAYEHSIELQLPFLQYLYGSAFKLVPICFLMQDLESSRDVGQATAKALSGKNALVIASTDMTHYEPQERAEKKDKMAIDAAIKMDEEKYYSTVESHAISTCGYGPTIAAITAAKALGAKKSQLLCYKTSGDITGDFSAVVGYASIAFKKS